MPRRLGEILRRPFRWLGPAAVLALMPKCVGCVLAYAGIGAALGLPGPEFCDPAAGTPGWWAPALASFSLALGIAGWLTRRSS